jgi:hypothetical protein
MNPTPTHRSTADRRRTKELPMTDSTLPDDISPIPDDAEGADEREQADRSEAREPAGENVPGSPGNAEPMTDSTDGGLEGGDPGVEE